MLETPSITPFVIRDGTMPNSSKLRASSMPIKVVTEMSLLIPVATAEILWDLFRINCFSMIILQTSKMKTKTANIIANARYSVLNNE